MELRPDCKKNEMGVIPLDWEIKTLGDIFSITAEGDLDKKNFSLVKDEKYCFPVYSNSLSDKGLYGYR